MVCPSSSSLRLFFYKEGEKDPGSVSCLSQSGCSTYRKLVLEELLSESSSHLFFFLNEHPLKSMERSGQIGAHFPRAAASENAILSF